MLRGGNPLCCALRSTRPLVPQARIEGARPFRRYYLDYTCRGKIGSRLRPAMTRHVSCDATQLAHISFHLAARLVKRPAVLMASTTGMTYREAANDGPDARFF